MDTATLVAILAVALGFIVQLLISLFVKWKWVHWIPTPLLALAGGVLLLLTTIIQGWEVLAYLLYAIYTWIAAAGALLGFLVGLIIRGIRRHIRSKKEAPKA